jgi:hypothetical protein
MHPISSGSYAALSDRDLLVTVKRLAERERQATAQLIALLSELDARRLYLGEGCSSLFTYCTQVLRLSEHAAYGRIEAARAARRFPLILELLADGSITLTTVTLLAPHLTSTNVCAVLEAARHKSKREVERQVASLRPLPDVPSSIRRQPMPPPAAPCGPLVNDGLLATPAPVSPAPPPSPPRASSSTGPHRDTTTATDAPSPRTPAPQPQSRRSVVEPLARERYKIRRIGVRLGNWLTAEQGRRLLDYAPPKTPRGLRDHAMVAMLIGCGLRRAELLALNLESIQQREEHWVIANLVGKGGHVRTVPIPTWVKSAVDAWTTAAAITHGPVFRAINKAGRVWGDGMSAKVLWDVVRAAAARAGIDKLAPHDLRRTCARLCHLAGGELDQIQFLLGHVSIQTTERYLGCKQKLRIAVNDRLGIEPDAA